jgi:hypothetical protein
MNDEDLEHSLKSLHWRSAKPDFLQRTLDAALAERRAVAKVSDLGGTTQRKPQRRGQATFFAFIPRPLRLPLAACWLLALFFKINTPDPISAQTRESIAHMQDIDPKQLMAKLEEEQRLTVTLLAELDAHHRSPADQRPISTEPVLP